MKTPPCAVSKIIRKKRLGSRLVNHVTLSKFHVKILIKDSNLIPAQELNLDSCNTILDKNLALIIHVIFYNFLLEKILTLHVRRSLLVAKYHTQSSCKRSCLVSYTHHAYIDYACKNVSQKMVYLYILHCYFGLYFCMVRH